MLIREVPYQKLEQVRPKLIRFLRLYGDKRITHKALRWLNRLPAAPYGEGTMIAIALDQKRLAGVLVIGRYGIEESLIAVKPRYRKAGLGKELVQYCFRTIDRMYARVATDNVPSLKLCFALGMVAFDLFTGVTGKPTLWFGLGNWDKNETRAAL